MRRGTGRNGGPPARDCELSILMPVYNEEATVQELVKLVVHAVLPAHMEKQIICINDCSHDGSGNAAFPAFGSRINSTET